MFTIAEFEDGVLAVPSKWIDKSKKECSYPPNDDDAPDFIKNCANPKKNWIKLPVLKIFGEEKNYADAKEKVETALIDSDLDQEKLKKNRASRKRLIQDDYDMDDVGIKTKKSKVTVSHVRPDRTDSSSDGEENDENSNDKQILLKPPTNVLTFASRRNQALRETNTNDMQLSEKLQYIISIDEENLQKNKRILFEVKELKTMMEGLGKKVDAADQRQDATKTGSNVKLTLKQFQTVKELEDFNEELKDESFYTKTVEALSKRGGKNFNDLTSNIMYKIMTDYLGTNYSLQGRQKKRSFKLLERLYSAIIGAVRMMFEFATEYEIETKIGSWLAQASVREGRKELKKADPPVQKSSTENTLNKDKQKATSKDKEQAEKVTNKNKEQTNKATNNDQQVDDEENNETDLEENE